jgi:hypothetical protein
VATARENGARVRLRLLLVSFRSIVIAAKAIVLNLLSVAAAYGVLVAVFQAGTSPAGSAGFPASSTRSGLMLLRFPRSLARASRRDTPGPEAPPVRAVRSLAEFAASGLTARMRVPSQLAGTSRSDGARTSDPQLPKLDERHLGDPPFTKADGEVTPHRCLYGTASLFSELVVGGGRLRLGGW